MRRVLPLLAGALALQLAATRARAETEVSTPVVDVGVATQELGARLGGQLDVAGPVAGGLRVGGLYLYRVTENVWFDGEASVAFGGTGNQCYLDRGRQTVCSPGLVSGFGFQVGAGLRWFPRLTGVKNQMNPYLRAGLGVDLSSFSADGVNGLGLPLWVGAGGRFRVSDRVAVGAEALLSVGPAFVGQGVGTVGFVKMIVQLGVELAL